ncbi:hypothetical protein [Pedosphaera parvula]|uniref:HD/PDEase domain-containing protein n=1 Tax=Pedosphaera parvula (strain Ellin514) TaxID=320771 RepID=B9XNK1_PEDPL|nr:hypothetical protein [Pedosphaera parvula]EEF58541.1 conserved hypothetical protein [Pedosphaera parvula Ellin514]
MYPPVVTKDATAVEAEVQSAYLTMFPQGDALFVPQVFNWASDCFAGRIAGYQPIDACYHDFEHTLQGTLCFARLLNGHFKAGIHPAITERMLQLGLIGILFHDTGYLKKQGDNDGTGAKYTATHVDRSMALVELFLEQKKGFAPEEIKAVKHMISCTGINAVIGQIPFQSEAEKLIGLALGTADLLGQMAAEDYVDKLPVLYTEFAEATVFSAGRSVMVGTFCSAEDLMQKTPVFWGKYVQPRLNTDFEAVFRFLNHPYPAGTNYYLEKIEANMVRLKTRLKEYRESVH